MELEVKDAEQSCEIRLREIDIGFEVSFNTNILRGKVAGAGDADYERAIRRWEARSRHWKRRLQE